MRTPDIEGVAIHDGPESCVGVREGGGEALTGADAGRPYTVPKAFLVPDADAHVGARKATPPGSPSRENRPGPAGPQNPRMRRNTSPEAGRSPVRPGHRAGSAS